MVVSAPKYFRSGVLGEPGSSGGGVSGRPRRVARSPARAADDDGHMPGEQTVQRAAWSGSKISQPAPRSASPVSWHEGRNQAMYIGIGTIVLIVIIVLIVLLLRRRV